MSYALKSFAAFAPEPVLRGASPSLLIEPSICTATDVNDVIGHGFGYDASTILSGLGEYLERFLLYRQPLHGTRLKLDEMDVKIGKKLSSKFTKLIEQTALNEYKSLISEHNFSACEVKRLSDDQNCLIPRIFLTLQTAADDPDADFLPRRDTSGSAIHTCRQESKRRAVLEFIERQCVTGMWVADCCVDSYPLEMAWLKSSKYQKLAQYMMEAGKITVYDISFIPNIFCYFLTYRGAEHQLTRFSCGSSASTHKETALEKAVLETWQTSRLMAQLTFFSGEEYGGSELKDAFKQANNMGYEFNISKRRVVTLPSSGDTENIFAPLSSISNDIFYNQQSCWYGGREWHLTRIISPDFFTHLNPAEHNNIDNKWCSILSPDGPVRISSLPYS